MSYITEVIVKDNIPVGLEEFSWQPNKGLNIITGLNGSGKTKLLNHIFDSYKKSFEIRNIPVDYNPPKFKGKHELENVTRKTKDAVFHSDGQLASSFDKEWLSNVYHSNDADRDILREILKIRKEFLAQKDGKSEQDAMKEWKGLTPWIDINNLFKTFGLKVKLEINNLGGEINFIRNNKPYKPEETLDPYYADSLSSGEQVAFTLAVWQWGTTVNKKSEILLIDEFAAHLNPSLINDYIRVIRKHFVDQGIQVIMTTHNPLLANLAEADELFWMQDGRIIKKDKNSIINSLSGDLFSARDLQGIFTILGTTGTLPKNILLVEGKDDELTLLKNNFNSEDTKILDCKSADNIPIFASIPYVQNDEPKPTIICLLDNDDKGKKVKIKLEELGSPCGNSIKVLFVSDIEGDSMEEVLEDKTLVKLNKLKLKIEKAKL